MSAMPNVHVFNSCFIIRMNELEGVKMFWYQYRVELFERKVILVEYGLEVVQKWVKNMSGSWNRQ